MVYSMIQYVEGGKEGGEGGAWPHAVYVFVYDIYMDTIARVYCITMALGVILRIILCRSFVDKTVQPYAET